MILPLLRRLDCYNDLLKDTRVRPAPEDYPRRTAPRSWMRLKGTGKCESSKTGRTGYATEMQQNSSRVKRTRTTVEALHSGSSSSSSASIAHLRIPAPAEGDKLRVVITVEPEPESEDRSNGTSRGEGDGNHLMQTSSAVRVATETATSSGANPDTTVPLPGLGDLVPEARKPTLAQLMEAFCKVAEHVQVLYQQAENAAHDALCVPGPHVAPIMVEAWMQPLW